MATVPDEKKCEYPFLGPSGIRVSNICLGTMTFGESLKRPGLAYASEETCFKLMQRFAELGGNFIDTADVYGRGISETIVGKWLERQPRENFILATKVRAPMGQNINNVGLSRRHITDGIERSLERLRTDYVDLYQGHIWDDGTPIEETLRTFDDLVRCGKIRYPGISNVTGWQLQKLVDTGKKLGLNPLVSLQQQYNLASRESENEPFQVCKNEGVAVLPWSPLKGGLFSGKVKRDKIPTEGRLGWVAKDQRHRNTEAAPAYSTFDDTIYKTLDVVESIAKKYGRSVPQVALRWLLQKDVVTSVVIGVRTLEQLEDNMEAASGWSLSRKDMQTLDDVSQRPLSYPYQMVFCNNKGVRFNRAAMNQYVESTSE